MMTYDKRAKKCTLINSKYNYFIVKLMAVGKVKFPKVCAGVIETAFEM